MIEPSKHGEAECAYLAGVLDQAAIVRVVREKRRRSVYRTLLLVVRGLSAETATWLLEKFGPGLSETTPEGVEITYVTRRAAEMCVHAYPYLIGFKARASLVTKFASSLGPKRTPLSPKNVAIRAEVDLELQAMDRGGRGRR